MRIARALAASTVLVGGALSTGPANAAEPVVSVSELTRRLQERERKLEQRDAVIRDLQRRVEQLERRMAVSPGATAGDARPAVARPAPGPASTPSEARPVAPSAPTAGPATASAPAPEETTRAAQAPVTPPPAPDSPEGEARPPRGAAVAGQFEVDPDAAERALERTLVAEGVVLLPFGKIEVEPSFTYTRRDELTQLLVALSTGEVVTGGQDRIERNELTPSTTFRVGLPFDSQLNLTIPYNIVDQQRVRTLGEARQVNDGWGSGLGDVSVGLAKTLVRERGWRPDVVGSVTWDSATGQRNDNGVPLEGGYNDLRGSLVASKRLDPLAFIASASYQRSFESHHVRPGNEIGFGLGTVLAASPETSLFVNFNQTFSNDVKVRGRVVNGTDQVQATIGTGVSVILGRGVLLTLSGGAGLTDDSPDYFVGISLPIRFDLPIQ